MSSTTSGGSPKTRSTPASSPPPPPTRSSQKNSPRSRRASISARSMRSRTCTPPTVTGSEDRGAFQRLVANECRSPGAPADQLALGELAGGGGLAGIDGGVHRVLGLDRAAGDQDGRE